MNLRGYIVIFFSIGFGIVVKRCRHKHEREDTEKKKHLTKFACNANPLPFLLDIAFTRDNLMWNATYAHSRKRVGRMVVPCLAFPQRCEVGLIFLHAPMHKAQALSGVKNSALVIFLDLMILTLIVSNVVKFVWH